MSHYSCSSIFIHEAITESTFTNEEYSFPVIEDVVFVHGDVSKCFKVYFHNCTFIECEGMLQLKNNVEYLGGFHVDSVWAYNTEKKMLIIRDVTFFQEMQKEFPDFFVEVKIEHPIHGDNYTLPLKDVKEFAVVSSGYDEVVFSDVCMFKDGHYVSNNSVYMLLGFDTYLVTKEGLKLQ